MPVTRNFLPVSTLFSKVLSARIEVWSKYTNLSFGSRITMDTKPLVPSSTFPEKVMMSSLI